jgi:hypothetical protein
MVMLSTRNRVYSSTIPAGNSWINISAGTSSRPETVKVRIAFQYTDSSPVQVTLPELLIHFMQNPSPAGSGRLDPVTSTSGAAVTGFGTSSVQIVQQPVPVQQQAGRDSSPAQVPLSNQMPQDAAALRAQLQQEAAQKAKNESGFANRLAGDPLVRHVNATLATDGFFRQSVNANPSGGDEGTFAMTYQNIAGDRVDLMGTMTGGVVSSVLEHAPASFNVSAPLNANATYTSFTGDLTDRGFKRNTTLMNVTLPGSTVSVTYLSGQGIPAYVNATIDRGNVTQVSLGIVQADTRYLLIGIIAALLIILSFIAWLMYRRYGAWKKILPPTVPPPRQPSAPDYKNEALRLLEEAEKSYALQEYHDAYGLAGRAARVFLSYEIGDRRELTNAELASVLPASGYAGRSNAVMAMLEQCSDVEFAKGLPDAREFPGMIQEIRELISAA